MRDFRGLHRWLVLPFLWNSQQRKIQSRELGAWCWEGLLLSFSHGHTQELGVTCSLQSHGPIVFRRCECHVLLDLITGLSPLCGITLHLLAIFLLLWFKKKNQQKKWVGEEKERGFILLHSRRDKVHNGRDNVAVGISTYRKQRWRTGSGAQLWNLKDVSQWWWHSYSSDDDTVTPAGLYLPEVP